MTFDPGTFMIGNRILPYLKSRYNEAQFTERTIEVPIALQLYNQATAKREEGRILEIGEILPHYHPLWEKGKAAGIYPHLCIDSISVTPGVTNSDIKKWTPAKETKFDLILSLSTMKHLFDLDSVRDDYHETDTYRLDQFYQLIIKLVSLLSEDGVLMISLPRYLPEEFGRGGWIDLYLKDLISRTKSATGRFRQADPSFVWKMNRMGYGFAGNKWKQAIFGVDPDIQFDKSTNCAGTVYFLFWGSLGNLWR